MGDEGLTQHDARRRRCPMLGHEVAFSYCRRPGRDLPCGRIADCWWEAFDVAGWLREQFSGEQLAEFLSPPKAKVASLVDLIRQARQRAGEGS